jgi:3-oxoacyl-[acyl-carrier-protein] synthase-3
MGNAKVIGVGASLPEQVIENQYFADYLDTSDEWIRTRTGIARRHVGGPTSVMAVEAGRRALEHAGVAPEEVDFLVLATSTPDQQLPQTSAAVHDLLGLHCPAFDINVACAGFVYAMAVGASLAGAHARVLVVGAEQFTRITDPNDRNTAVLMADGAGAVLLERTDSPQHAVWADLGVDGSLRSALYADHGGYFVMKGAEVFKNAVRLASESIERVLDEAGLKIEDVHAFVPHQANQRIIDAIAARVGLSDDRSISIIEGTGNTGAASVPLALAAAVEDGRIRAGDNVLLAGFGAGMAWGTALLHWA